MFRAALSRANCCEDEYCGFVAVTNGTGNKLRGRLVTDGGVQLMPAPVAGSSFAAGVYVYP